MIYLYSGTPGSGKSLHQARDIYHTLRNNGTVIANYDIDITKIPHCKGQFIYLDNEHLTPEILTKFSKVFFHDHRFYEGRLKLYVDEAQLLFSCRDWGQRGRREWISFFTQHRKYGYDIFLVAQFDRMLDRQIRSLIEYEFIHRKATNGSILGKWIGLIGDFFVSVEVWYPMKEKISAEYFLARKKYYQIYDTLKILDETDNDSEKEIEISRLLLQ